MTQDFLLQIFFMIVFPQAPENNARVILNFFKNLRKYSQVKVHHRYKTTSAAKLLPVSMTPVANLSPVSTTPAVNFATSFAGGVDTGGRCRQYWWRICHRCHRYWRQICHSVNGTGGKLPPVSVTTGGKLPPVSTTPAANLTQG